MTEATLHASSTPSLPSVTITSADWPPGFTALDGEYLMEPLKMSSSTGKAAEKELFTHSTRPSPDLKLLLSVNGTSSTAPMPLIRASRKSPTSASLNRYIDCMGSPTTKTVLPSPLSHPRVSASRSFSCAREVSWYSSTRICLILMSRESIRSVGSSSLPRAESAAMDIDWKSAEPSSRNTPASSLSATGSR